MAQRFSTITQSVMVNASPEEVYDAMMDSKKHAKVTGSPASISTRVGGKFTAWDGYIFGKNLDLEPGKRIVQERTTTEWPEGYPPSKLEISLTKKPGGTELKMVHSKGPDRSEGRVRRRLALVLLGPAGRLF
jgi:uncharacterized protein YndB with AHSA1/START domain